MESIFADHKGGGQNIDRELFRVKLSPFVVSQRIRTINKDNDHEEMIWEIKTKGELDLTVVDELMSVPGVQSVNWIVESGETVG